MDWTNLTHCAPAWWPHQGSPLAFFFESKEDPVERTKRLLKETDAVFFDVDSIWERTSVAFAVVSCRLRSVVKDLAKHGRRTTLHSPLPNTEK